jgi:DNA polymerase-1
MPEVPSLKIRVLTEPGQVSTFWEWLTDPRRRMVACDTENTGFDWWNPGFRVRVIQFGDVEGGWAIPFDGWQRLVQGALDHCSRARIPVVFHNPGYDINALRSQGVTMDWSIVEDTFTWSAIVGYAEHNRQLKSLAQRYFGQWAGAGERVLHEGMKKQGWTWADVPLGWKPYPLYAVVDTAVTAALWERWDSMGLRRRWGNDHALEMASLKITSEMSWRGLPVDGGYLWEQIDAFLVQEAEVRARLEDMGITSPHQGGQLEAVLKDAGVALPEKTEKGKTKLDEAVLSHIDHPAAADVLRFRQLYKTRTSYLQSLLEGAGGSFENGVIPEEGAVVHPGIKPFEARTGRMSIENPPLQQLPAEDPTVRRAVISREKDEIVISSDWGQIELRMWASLNSDQGLIDALAKVDETGSDFFVELGREVYKDPGFVKSDPRRGQLKSTVYAKLFAGGIETAAATAGVNVYDLVPTWKAMEAAYPSLKTLGEDLVKTHKNPEGELEHVITSSWGREWRVLDPVERRKLGNYATQGSAAIALKKCLVSLEAAGFGPYMMLPVHDEVLFSVPKTDAEDAMAEIKQVMDSIVHPGTGWTVPVTAKPGAGANWAEAK